MNKIIGEHEQIKQFRLVCEEWSLQTVELSQTSKLKRNKIYIKYKVTLEDIYGHS